MEKIKLQNSTISLYPGVKSRDDVIIIVHGASEGESRYRELASKLCMSLDVITYNHPGHETQDNVKFTYLQILKTTNEVINYGCQNYQNVTLYAHSMGSLVVRNLIFGINQNVKIILSGAPVLSLSDKLSSYGGLALLTVLSRDKVNKQLNYLVFDQKASKHELDDKKWICSLQDVVCDYKTDGVSNYLFTNESLKALIKLSLKANTKSVYEKLNNYELLLISGAVDHFTNNGQSYYKICKYAVNSQVNIYENSYHEVHNDIDKNQLVKDILKFIEKDVNGKN